MLKLRVGVIGVGGAGSGHLKSYLSLPNVEVTAVSDVDKEVLEKVAAENKIPNVFTDYKEMLSIENLDAVSVCTPNYLHASISIAALEAGKHVLCEKPVAMNATEAEKVAKKVDETGKKFVIGYWIPHTPEGKTLKKFVDAGRLGDIYFAKTGWIRRHMFQNPRWFSVKDKSGGGPLMDIGVHVLDAALWMMYYPDPVSVLGLTYTKVAPKHLREIYGDTHSLFDVEDMACAMIKFNRGATLFLEVSWASYIEKEKIYIDLCGTEGGAAFDFGAPNPLRVFTDTEKTPIVVNPDLSRMKRSSSVEYFIDCITRDV
jgi:predicted dehydrogenase